MDGYSIYEDFANYINENNKLIDHLIKSDSILKDHVYPIIKALSFLKKQKEVHDEDLSKDDQNIFSYGFELLFENVEQIKLYLKQLNNDYNLLEKNSVYIKMIFQLEELRVEIQKYKLFTKEEKENDIKEIEKALNFFEDLISTDVNSVSKEKVNENILIFNQFYDKYDEIVLLSDAFNQYCATYGI